MTCHAIEFISVYANGHKCKRKINWAADLKMHRGFKDVITEHIHNAHTIILSTFSPLWKLLNKVLL